MVNIFFNFSKYCNSVRHLSHECKPNNDGAIELGVMDLNQGGDDDDVFLSIHKQQKDGFHEKKAAENIIKAMKTTENIIKAEPSKIKKIVNF
jgi:hypothetical protein